jgi:FecR protein
MMQTNRSASARLPKAARFKRSFQMESASRHILKIVGLVLFVSLGFAATTAQAQNREKYIISAKAGGINFVSGNVTVQRKGDTSQRALASTDDLQTGDSVTTGAGGRVEVLLNPGSYMRVGENSEFELADASLDNLLIKLVKGSAVLEVTGAEGMELAIRINTPQADALIVRGGIYRFNVLPSELTEILVRKGRVLLGSGIPTEVKGGKKVLVGRGLLEVVKLDKKDLDTLDLWSKDRAELLARANNKLQYRSLVAAFDHYSWNSFNWWGQSQYGSLGLWVYNPTVRSYCFLPGTSRHWSSPYGHRYGNGVGYGGGRHWTGGGGHQPSGNGYPSGTGSTGSTGTTSGNGNGNPAPAPAPAPAPQPVYHPPARPSNDSYADRTPRKVYTDQGPNR